MAKIYKCVVRIFMCVCVCACKFVPITSFSLLLLCYYYSENRYCDQLKSCCLADSPLGVVDEIVAIGPLPASVMAQILKVYNVDGLKLCTTTDLTLASFTDISRSASGPTTCNVYPVMIVLCSSGRGFHEISAEVGTPCLILSPV